MLYEIDAFGLKATLVEPGHVRLDEATGLDDKAADNTTHESSGGSGNNVRIRRYGHFLVKKPSEPYDTATAPAGHARRVFQWLADRQPTSAVKSAELVWQLGHCRFPPLRLLLGSFAVESVRDRLKSVTEEIEDWKHLAFPVADEDRKGKDVDARGEDGDEEMHDEVEAGAEGLAENFNEDDEV